MTLSDALLDATVYGVVRKPPALPLPPRERSHLLAELGPASHGLYLLVRDTVDELERVIGWGLLYYPPDDREILAGRFDALAACIRRLPARLQERLVAFPVEELGEREPLRGEVEFYFDSIARMVTRDLERLESATLQLASGALSSAEDTERLCELAADLKGKFASAIMGATAALVAAGRWQTLDAEVILFPERAEDARLSRELATALRAMVDWLAELYERVPLARIVARWREGQRADQYAFSDLVVLRGHLGSLLREGARRALYSGDYHQIRWREVRLAERLDELERLHRDTWAVSLGVAADRIVEHLARFETLVSEIAALLDVNQLSRLIGADAVQRLRTQPKGESLEPSVGLAHFVAHDDLQIFCRMLLGSVERRGALVGSAPQSAPTTAARPEHGNRSGSAPRAPERAPAPPALPPQEQAALVAELRTRLAAQLNAQSSNWNSFRMVRRMFERHGRVPDEMFRAAQPFVEELLSTILPELRQLAPYRGLTVEHVERLEGTCRSLVIPADGGPLESAVQQRLERLQRFLDALRMVLEMG
ncbi:MAG: hypothetical protein ABI609_17575 [Acidobacteriota bacterium]